VRIPYVIHIAAGALALVFGFVALYAAKGGTLHRKSGMLFVYVMLVMAGTGAVLSALQGVDGSVIAGVMTCYLVITALSTVTQPAGWSRRLDVGLMALALTLGVTSLTLGFLTVASPTGRRNGLPPFPFFMFGIVAIVAGIGDLRVLRSGPPRGAARISRHLWRMSWALWVATTSFFLGQAKVIPKPIRIPALLALPVIAVTVTMLYWLWRVRGKRALRGIVAVRAPEVA
jgi:uncharacterized membrane protein